MAAIKFFVTSYIAHQIMPLSCCALGVYFDDDDDDDDDDSLLHIFALKMNYNMFTFAIKKNIKIYTF